MEPDEALARASDPLADLAKQDLDRFSVSELEERIRVMDAEIVRARAKIGHAVSHRASADALFKR